MTTTPDEVDTKNKLSRNIASEIILSDRPWEVFKKWRTTFKISQNEMAKELGVSASVVCDYESGRRKSPGIKIIKRYIEGLFSTDVRGGGAVLKTFQQTSKPNPDSTVIDIKEFFGGMGIGDFCKTIDSDFIHPGDAKKEVYGYTIIDSIRAITELSFNELAKIYGSTTQRALVFTKVSTGRTPLVAIKLTNLKPGLVILHGSLTSIDPVAKMIAEHENIPLALCNIPKHEDLLERLKKME